ncbi:hypothetical protein BROC_00612 [Candidatus Brocadiaceae bacterium]|nr:hypothetical protein BROC_00612 [Candidatus Brocadiaceae bacterium]
MRYREDRLYRLWILFSGKILLKRAYNVIKRHLLPPLLYNAADPGKGGFSNESLMK